MLPIEVDQGHVVLIGPLNVFVTFSTPLNPKETVRCNSWVGKNIIDFNWVICTTKKGIVFYQKCYETGTVMDLFFSLFLAPLKRDSHPGQ